MRKKGREPKYSINQKYLLHLFRMEYQKNKFLFHQP